VALTTTEWGFVICLGVSLMALLLAVLSLRQIRRQAFATEKMLQRLMREVAASSSGAVGMGQRLLAMEKRLQEAPSKAATQDYYQDDDFQSYSQAAQLFKMGLDVDEVARRCGLSRAEASLLEVMQKSGN